MFAEHSLALFVFIQEPPQCVWVFVCRINIKLSIYVHTKFTQYIASIYFMINLSSIWQWFFSHVISRRLHGCCLLASTQCFLLRNLQSNLLECCETQKSVWQIEGVCDFFLNVDKRMIDVSHCLFEWNILLKNISISMRNPPNRTPLICDNWAFHFFLSFFLLCSLHPRCTWCVRSVFFFVVLC